MLGCGRRPRCSHPAQARWSRGRPSSQAAGWSRRPCGFLVRLVRVANDCNLARGAKGTAWQPLRLGSRSRTAAAERGQYSPRVPAMLVHFGFFSITSLPALAEAYGEATKGANTLLLAPPLFCPLSRRCRTLARLNLGANARSVKQMRLLFSSPSSVVWSHSSLHWTASLSFVC